MKKNYLQSSSTVNTLTQTVPMVAGPKKETLAFIRQFARVYHAVNAMPGIVLN